MPGFGKMGARGGFGSLGGLGGASLQAPWLTAAPVQLSTGLADAQCWFHEPRARRVGNKLFFGASGSDDLTNNTGRASLYELDIPSGVVAARRDFATGSNWSDDHNYPVVLVRPDGRLIAFYCAHSLASEPIRYRISVAPGTGASGWSQEYNIGTQFVTYPSPVMLAGESNRIYLFFRDSNVPGYSYFTSDDLATVAAPASDGAALGGSHSWSSKSTIFSLAAGHAAYVKVHSNGVDRIDFCVCDAAGQSTNPKIDIRHLYYKSGGFFGANAASLGSLPITFSSIPAIATSSSPDNFGDVWPHHMVYRADNNIEVVFSRLISVSDHRAYYASWNGSAWSKGEIDSGLGSGVPDTRSSQISDGGFGTSEGFYSPGLYIDYGAPGTVYASVGNSQGSILYRYKTANAGSSWIRQRVSDQSNENVRPFVPQGGGPIGVLWLKGQYFYFDFAATAAADNGYTTKVYAASSVYALPEYVANSANLLAASERINSWLTQTAVTITPNVVVNPIDGLTTADRVAETTATSTHNTNPASISFTAGKQYTFCIYAKYETVKWIQLLFGSAAFGGSAYANFDIQNGVVGGRGNVTFSNVESIGSGWYRLVVTAVALTTASTTIGVYGAQSTSSARAPSYAGNAANTWLLFGGQVQQEPFDGAYQATS